MIPAQGQTSLPKPQIEFHNLDNGIRKSSSKILPKLAPHHLVRS